MAHALTHCPPAPAARNAGLLHRLRLGLAALRQRRHLASLDDARLNDIGLTREDATREATRPVWDVPAHWLER